MEMVINGFALNIASEEAIAPRQNVFSWIVSKIASGSKNLPAHILGYTKLEL
jgi:hypothetical protein